MATEGRGRVLGPFVEAAFVVGEGDGMAEKGDVVPHRPWLIGGISWRGEPNYQRNEGDDAGVDSEHLQ